MGERLKRARLRAGLSQKEAATQAGAHPVSVSRWESETREIGYAELATLARVYGTSVAALMGEAPAEHTGTETAPGAMSGAPGAGYSVDYWRGYQTALLGIMETVAAMQRQSIDMQRRLVAYTDPVPRVAPHDEAPISADLYVDAETPPAREEQRRRTNGGGGRPAG